MTKILYIAANPRGAPQLQVDKEIRIIREGLDGNRQFDFHYDPKTQLHNVTELLKKLKPDILHFSVHGGQGQIFLEDENGNANPVSNEALTSILFILKSKVQCVVLNACYTESLALAIAEIADCVVVGMQGEIQDQYAIDFARTFYREITDGHDLARAFKLGRDHMGGDRELARMFTYNISPSEVIFVNRFTREIAFYILAFLLPITLLNTLIFSIPRIKDDFEFLRSSLLDLSNIFGFTIQPFFVILVLVSFVSICWGLSIGHIKALFFKK